MNSVELKEEVLVIDNESALTQKSISDDDKKQKRITTIKWIFGVIGTIIGFIVIILIWLLVADVIQQGACYVCGGYKRAKTAERMCNC